MQYITHNDQNINTHMTSYQGKIEASYSQLTVLFGQPHAGDGYKVDAEWKIEWEDGVVATIYNWKDGVSYLGWQKGIPTDLISEWHIGGKSYGRDVHESQAQWLTSGRAEFPHVERIKDLIENFDKITTVQGHNYEFTHKSDEC